MDLKVGVRLLCPRVDLDQALEARSALTGRRAAPVHVALRRSRLVQVHGEQVQVLMLLGEEQATEGHLPAGLGDSQLEVLAHEMAAEQRRQPVAVCVAADAHEARRDVEDFA